MVDMLPLSYCVTRSPQNETDTLDQNEQDHFVRLASNSRTPAITGGGFYLQANFM
jgi:hypothetical protein